MNGPKSSVQSPKSVDSAPVFLFDVIGQRLESDIGPWTLGFGLFKATWASLIYSPHLAL